MVSRNPFGRCLSHQADSPPPTLGPDNHQRRFIRYIGLLSFISLLYNVIVLLGSQGVHVARQITSVRVRAALVVYIFALFGFTVLLRRKFGFCYRTSCAQSFIAASNDFDLEVAVVAAVYGAGSGQALAATVGPLVEVPILAALVDVLRFFKRRWNWGD